MKKIGIDVRMIGLKHAGIGRYVKNLVKELKKSNAFEFLLLKDKARHYSLKEQVFLPWKIWRSRVDLVHFPHFNVPILCPIPFIVTIHDLIKHRSKGLETTTHFPPLYWFKFLVYLLVFRLAVKRAKKIIVPSKSVKEELQERYNLKPQRIEVVYEGVSEEFRAIKGKPKVNLEILKKYQINKPFIIYTGSLYPHKNVDRLVQAARELKIVLAIVCSRSVFWERMRRKIKKMKAERFVKLLGFVPDKELVALYQEAIAFVQPSLMEGFDLTVVEAMASGLPVVISDIPVHREIVESAAIYFNPYDFIDIAEKINLVLQSSRLGQKLRQKGLLQAQKYSWQKMGQAILRVYEKSI